METLELARSFMTALEGDETEAARKHLDPAAGIWHNFDAHTQTVDENMALFEWMRRKARNRRYEITRLEEIEGGYLQQHILRMENQAGEELVLHACVVVSVADGLITRIEEYLDPAPTSKLR